MATTVAASAQEEPEYKLEIGAGTGLLSYVGDYNSSLVKGLQPWLVLKADEFNHRITETDLRFEYNFWAYGTGNEYRGARRLAPFITAGLGATFYGGPEKGATMNVPLGAGVKYKIGKRLNLTVEWAMRFTLSDKLDGSKDPLGIKSSGLFKNTDCYSALQLGLTYDLWEKCKTCNNDRY